MLFSVADDVRLLCDFLTCVVSAGLRHSCGVLGALCADSRFAVVRGLVSDGGVDRRRQRFTEEQSVAALRMASVFVRAVARDCRGEVCRLGESGAVAEALDVYERARNSDETHRLFCCIHRVSGGLKTPLLILY